MNFISTGVKEVTRRLRRSKNRLALANARKFVEKAETALGRHGWRKLADDESVRPVYERILALDQDVAASNTLIAGHEAGIREQEAARELAAREHQVALDAIEAERGPAQQTLLDLQTRRAEHQRVLHDQAVRKAALQTEQAAFLKQEKRARRQNLLADEAERAARQKQLDEQRAGLAEKAAQLAVARSQAVEPVVADQDGIKEVRARLKALDKRIHDATIALATRERAIDLAIADLNKQIAATRRQAARVEEDKHDSYLAMGRRLAELAAAAPDGGRDELFTVSRRQRQNYEKLIALDNTWLHESQHANKQDLRIFNFVGITAAVLIAITLLLVFHAPVRRDWLPKDTQTILTVDVSRFTDADFTRAFQSQVPEEWQSVWMGLLRKVAEVPQIDVRGQVTRITRAFAPSTTPGGPPVDYLLVKMRDGDAVERLRTDLWTKGGFGPWPFHNLTVYENASNLAVAQVGPDTVALGTRGAVEDLIRVRLGLSDDLRSDAQFFSEFQRLSDDSAFRLVTYQPRDLVSPGNPVLNMQFLDECQTLGLTLDMHEPVSAVIVLNAANAREAGQIARLLEARPDEVLQLASAGPNLFIEPPSVHTNDKQVEWRFRMTAPAAREFLQRVTRLGLPNPDKAVAAQ